MNSVHYYISYVFRLACDCIHNRLSGHLRNNSQSVALYYRTFSNELVHFGRLLNYCSDHAYESVEMMEWESMLTWVSTNTASSVF